MKHWIRNIIISLVASFLSLNMMAVVEFHLVQFTTVDGLTNNTVRKIIQDSKGRIWIATSNGLSCYDGNTFTNYRASHNGNTNGLTDQRVSNIYEDSHKHLWILSPDGDIACFDIESDTFIDYKGRGMNVPDDPDPNPRTMVTDSQGRIWETTNNGLYVVDPKTGERDHFCTHSPNNPLPTDALKCIFIDNNGLIWIGTDNLGISQLRVMQNEGVEYILRGENIRMLMPLDDGTIAVGNRSGDMWIYDYKLKKRLESIHREENTYCAMLGDDGLLWQGTKGAGLIVGTHHFTHSMTDKSSISHNDVYSIVRDYDGRIWVGTFGGGVCLTIPDAQDGWHFATRLSHGHGGNYVRRMINDSNKQIWTATSNGVYIFNPLSLMTDSTTYIHLCTDNEQLASNEVRTLFCASDGKIYVSEAGEGFSIFETSTGMPHLVHRVRESVDSLVNSMVQCFVEDNNGIIWVSTEFGISRYDPTSMEISSFFFSSNMLNNVYSENCGVCLSDGRIAFGTNNGIAIIDTDIYNKSPNKGAFSREDVVVSGQSPRHNIIYIISRWWASPWAIVAYLVAIITICVWLTRVKRVNMRFHHAIKELRTRNNDMQDRFSHDIKLRVDAARSDENKLFLTKVDDVITNELDNPMFTANDFADSMGMGRTVFFSRMRTITGYSPKEYLNLHRLKHAAELISSTTLSIAEVSDRVGISDPLYLSRIFRRHYGCSPTEWRKRNTK